MDNFPELRPLLEKFEAYCECDEYHIHSGPAANSDPDDGHYDFDIDKLEAAIIGVITDSDTIDLGDVPLKGFVEGQRATEEIRLAENQLWQELATKLRKLAQKHGASRQEIFDCWRVKESVE